MFIPVFLTHNDSNCHYDSYDDSHLMKKIEELEDTISQCTGVESEATKQRRWRRECEQRKYDLTLKMEDLPKETMYFLIHGYLAEEYKYPYLDNVYDKCFSVYHHRINYPEDSYRYYHLDDLKHSYEDEPKWITYKVYSILKRKLKFFKVRTGYRIVKVTAPKMALDAIVKDYEDEYLPKLKEILKVNPLEIDEDLKNILKQFNNVQDII